MPHFFFHLQTPYGREIDETGTSFPSAEHAMSEGWRALLEISTDLMHQQRSPAGYRFEVVDSKGRPVFDVAFGDLSPRAYRQIGAAVDASRTRLSETMSRSRALQSEVATAVAEVRATLLRTRALLDGRPSVRT
jgi:hypothetical protein